MEERDAEVSCRWAGKIKMTKKQLKIIFFVCVFKVVE